MPVALAVLAGAAVTGVLAGAVVEGVQVRAGVASNKRGARVGTRMPSFTGWLYRPRETLPEPEGLPWYVAPLPTWLEDLGLLE